MSMKRSIILYITCLASILLGIVACTPDNQVINNPDLVFPNSFSLNVPSYYYLDSMYYVSGDSGYASAIVDTLNNDPLFRWDTFNTKITCCAIFMKQIIVKGGIITNPEDMVWQWHSGMKKGQNGYVQFSDGKNVINDTIDYGNAPFPLKKHNYFWAVWAWNNSATSILYSSRQMQFYVSK